MNPLVSVVVTTYNQASYIDEALQSVFAQTYPHMEVIVVDDGSTDETPARLARFGDKIVYIRQRNRGVAASRNAGVLRARGELVAFLDGDDVWEPEKLSVQVAAAQRYPGSGLIVVDGLQFDATGILIESLLDSPHAKGFLDSTERMYVTGSCYNVLLQGNFISTTSEVMVPASVLVAVGPSDTRFRVASDYDLYLRIAARYDVTVVKLPLVRWRYLPSSASGSKDRRSLIWGEEDIKVWKKHWLYAWQDLKPAIRKQISARLMALAREAYYYGRKKNRIWASRYLLKLLLGNLSSSVIFPLLAALWCPQGLATALSQPTRKLLGLRM